MKVVKFLKHWNIYNAGEIAGLDATLADRLIDARIAVPISKEAKRASIIESTLGEPEKASIVDGAQGESEKGLSESPKDKMVKESPKDKIVKKPGRRKKK